MHPEPSALPQLLAPFFPWVLTGILLMAGACALLALRLRRTSRLAAELEQLFTFSLDMLCSVGKDGRFIRLNPAWEKSLGYHSGEMEGMRYTELVHPDDLAAVRDTAALLRGNESVAVFTCRTRHKNGGWRWIEWNAQPRGGVIIAAARDVTGRMEAEEALRESEERFRSLLDTVESVSVQGYEPDGTVVYWNKASEVLYGFSREEALGRNLTELIIPLPMRGEVRQAIRSMAETGQPLPASELTLERKGGEPIQVFSSHAAVRTAAGNTVLFCLDVDIGPLKRAEHALRQSEERFRLLVENAGDAIYLADIQGRLLEVNAEATRQTGFTRQELLAMSVTDLDPELTQEGLADLIRNVSQGRPAVFGARLKTSAGPPLPVEFRVAHVEYHGAGHLLGIARDVSHHQREEELLTAANRTLTAILENVPSEVNVVDVEKREIVFMNQTMKEAFGRDSTGDVCHMAFRSRAVPCEKCDLGIALDPATAASPPRLWEDFNPVSRKWYLNHDRVVRWFDGRTMRVQMSLDITDRKAAEERMAASLREKEVLLAEVHHRVKNNLQIVSSLLSLQEQELDTPQALDALAESQGRIFSMALIHEQLYNSHDFGRIAAKDYLERLLSRLHDSCRGSRDIRLETDLEDVPLTLDQAIPFGLVVNELATNAYKHGLRHAASGRLRVTLRNEGGEVSVTMEDDGCGLPEGFGLERASSLGLLLVGNLCAQLRGRVEAQSRPGSTLFSLRFPLARVEPAA